MEDKDRIVNALKWQACADAVGDRFEFVKNPKKSDVLALIKGSSPIGITDDTQMTMFGIEGLKNSRLESTNSIRSSLERAYRRWFTTQHTAKPPAGSVGLASFPEMYRVRAPGNTCLSSIRDNFQYKNNSKGCGTVMRALPFAMFSNPLLAALDASLTHHHEEILRVATEQHLYLRELACGKIPESALRGLKLRDVYGDGGWTAQSCWDIGLWAFENCDGDYQTMLTMAICHPGDSDSTAAVAGALFGLRYKEEPPMLHRLQELRPLAYTISNIMTL